MKICALYIRVLACTVIISVYLYNYVPAHSVNLCALCVFQPVVRGDREVIARLRNCVKVMAEQHLMLYDTSILYTYEASEKFPVSLPHTYS